MGFKQPETGTSSVTPNLTPASSSSASSSTISGRVPIYLRDVAKIKFANKDPENIVTINGERCIGLSIYKEPKFNTVEVVKSLGKAFASLGKGSSRISVYRHSGPGKIY